MTLSIAVISIPCCYAERHIFCFAEYHSAECCLAECHYAECCYAECQYAECCFAECRYTECHLAQELLD